LATRFLFVRGHVARHDRKVEATNTTSPRAVNVSERSSLAY